ncbi:MAG: recombination mediator RecR [Planctomycetota bacterium]
MPQPTQPSAYDHLLTQLETLPSIGRRSAERIAFALLRQPAAASKSLADAITAFRTNLKVCSVTGHVSESDPCAIATDPKRDHHTVLVVEQPSDVIAMEQTGAYQGSYHVLMGRLAPLDPAPFDTVGPGDLNLDSLLSRIEKGQNPNHPDWPEIKEVILGTNPTLEGDGTALYLTDRLENTGPKITRLARGLPANANLQQASKAVLADALHARRRP